MQASETLLSVENLSNRYADSLALSNISFHLKSDEILGLIGPNGAGKTTLLECVSGLIPAATGSVSDQTGVVALSLRKQLLFYLPDHVNLYPEQYVIHVLEFFAQMFHQEPGKPGRSLKEIVELLELQSILTKRVAKLSKGYKRRLLLAVALLSNQRVLFLDEPFDGLDLRQTRQAMDLIKSLKNEGRSLLLSIHQIADAERICDRFLLLSNGALLGSGTLEELREQASLPDGSLEEVFLALT